MRPADAIAAIRAFQDAIKGEVVTASEIDRRERICRTCPKRVAASRFVTKVSKVLGVLANRHRVPHDVRDFSCGVCGCSLMLILPATEADQHVDSPAEAANRPAFCWLTKSDKPD